MPLDDDRILELVFNPIIVDGKTTGVSVFGKDITERRKSESAIKKAEANLSALIESTQDLIWSVDLDYRLVTFNQALQQNIQNTYGVRIEAGMCFHEALTPERAARWPGYYARVVTDGPFRVEYSRIDGGIMELAFNPIVVEGITTGISVFGKVITERKKAEESRRFLAEVVESCEEAILTYTPSGIILTWNHGAEEIYGYSANEAIGKPMSMAVAPERREVLDRVTRQLLGGAPVIHERGMGLRKDGVKFHNSVTTWPIRNLAGEVTAICTIVRDVSVRHEAERTRALLASVVESSGDAIHAVNLDGTIASWNRGAEQMCGYTSEEILGKSVAILVPPGHEEVLRKSFTSLRDGCATGPFDVVILHKDGTGIDVSLTLSPIRDSEGKVVGGAAIARDIRQRKQIEMQLHESLNSLKESQEIGGLGSYVLDFGTGVWTGSDVLDEVFGIGKEYEHTVAGWTALIHPDDRVMIAAYFEEEVVGKGRNFNREYRIVRQSDQAERWVHGIGRLEFGDKGQPVKMRGVIKDITESKLSEMQVHDSEERYRATFEQAAVGIVHASFEGIILRGNQRFATIIGYSPEEIPGLSVRQITAPEERDASAEVIQRVAGGAGAEVIEKRYIRKDGSLFWAKTTVSMQHDSQGRPLHTIAFIEDINERMEAEKQLRVSEERYRAIFEQAPVGIIHASLDGRYLRCNAHFAEIIGYPQEDVLRLSFQQITVPEDLESSLGLLHQLREGAEEIPSIEKRYVRKDGSLVWVRVTLSLQRDGEGRLLYFIAIVEEIQARKEAEERLKVIQETLQASEERYRTVFETSPDAVIIARLSDGVILDVNQSFQDSTGFKRNEVMGHSVVQLGLWENDSEKRLYFDQLSQQGKCREIQVQSRRKNGELFWMQLSASLIEIGGERCRITFAKDISEIKAAEARTAAAQEALRRSEDRYRTAFQMHLDAIDICRLENGRYIDVNEAFVRCTGFQREEVIGRTAQEIGIWSDPGDRQKMIDALRQNEGRCTFEAPYRTKNGDLRWGLLSIAEIELDGVPCILSITRDITDARAAEERLAAVQETLRASEEHYRIAFQTSLDTIGINRIEDGMHIDVNDSFLRMFGYQREEVIGHTSLELQQWADPEDRQRWIEALRKDSVCLNMEARLRQKNGNIIWGRISGSLIELNGEQCVLVVSRNITEEKASEERLAAFQETLRTSEVRYRTIFEASADAVIITGLSDGKIIDANQTFCDSAGYERHEVLGRTGQELGIWVNESDRQRFFDGLAHDGTCRDFEALSRRRNGETFWMRISASNIEIEGIPCRLIAARDISEAKGAEERLVAAASALQSSEERYRTAFQTNLDAININRIDDGRFIDCNQAFLDMTGYKREEVLGRTTLELEIWADARDRKAMVKMVRRDSSCRGLEIQFKKKNGEVFWGEMSASLMDIDGVPCILSIIRDLSAAKAAESTIRSLAFYDPLTGLPNRRHLMERLRQPLNAGARSGRSHALLLVDLDHFKTLNDTLGHQTGDLLLQEVARRIVACAHEADTVCRLGGDEFVVVLEDLSKVAEEAAAQAQDVGEKISWLRLDRPCLLEEP